MRKCVLAFLILTGVAGAQKLPLLHRDPVNAERAALREKMTRLGETRKSLGMPEVQPTSAGELEALTAKSQLKPAGGAGSQQRAKGKTVAAPHAAAGKPVAALNTSAITPGTEVIHAAGSDEVPLGDAARQYRAQKRQARSKTTN